jgi:mitochondrial import inner membrane translocase subunit TIM17
MVSNRDIGREPCPDRIVEDLGGAFGMGAIGGFLWHFVKGARNSPKGDRFHGALFAGRTRAPILGGNFAVWGGTFSSFDCTLQYLRNTDDHWNAVASGFLTGGVLAARGGVRAAGQSALVGGVLLGIIECVAAVIGRTTSVTPREQALQQIQYEQQMKKAASTNETSSSWSDWMASLSNGPSVPKSGAEDQRDKKHSEFAPE